MEPTINENGEEDIEIDSMKSEDREERNRKKRMNNERLDEEEG